MQTLVVVHVAGLVLLCLLVMHCLGCRVVWFVQTIVVVHVTVHCLAVHCLVFLCLVYCFGHRVVVQLLKCGGLYETVSWMHLLLAAVSSHACPGPGIQHAVRTVAEIVHSP